MTGFALMRETGFSAFVGIELRRLFFDPAFRASFHSEDSISQVEGCECDGFRVGEVV